MSPAILDNNSNRPQAEMAIAPKQRALAENLDTHFDFIVCGAGLSYPLIFSRAKMQLEVGPSLRRLSYDEF